MASSKIYPNMKRDNLSYKKKSKKSTKNLNNIMRDYKILLGFNFLWVLPYLPSHLCDRFPEGNILLWMFLTVLLNMFKTLLALLVLIYANILFPGNKPLAMTFSIFTAFSIAVAWSAYFSRRRILKVVQMLLVITSQVTHRTFKSKWNVYFHAIFSITGTIIFSISLGFTGIQTYNNMKVTSSHFLWYHVTEEYSSTFRLLLVVVVTVSFIFCALTCGFMMLLGSTVYFHIGDILLNYGTKLKKRFEYHPINKDTLSENLSMFEKIAELVRTVNDAFSVGVLFIYGGTMSIFFSAICGFRTYDSTGFIILISTILIFALYCFLSLTVTGDRISRKHMELRETLISCSNITITNEHSEKIIVCFTMMSVEIKSAELYVTGGYIFTISNSLLLSVTAAMITYGVLIIQMN